MILASRTAGFSTPFLAGFLFLISSVVCVRNAVATVDFGDVFGPFDGFVPSSVELQGGVPDYTYDELMDVKEGLEEAIKLVKYLAPAWQKKHFFAKRDPTENRRFVIVLTDVDDLRPNDECRVNLGFTCSTLSMTTAAEGEDPVQTLYFVFRLDKLMFDRGGRGFRADAFYNLAAHLFLQTYGFNSYVLENPVTVPGTTSRSPEEWFITTRRAIRVLNEALNDGKTALVDGAGPLRAKFFMLLTQLKSLLSQRTGKAEGPLKMPFGIMPGAYTLESLPEYVRLEAETTIWWALSLVRSYPPANLPFNLFHATSRDMAHWEKLSLMIRWMDLRDTQARKHHSPSNTTGVPAEWVKSDVNMCYTPTGTQFDQAIWTDRTIYDRDHNIRPERLAAVAMSFASIAYGWIQPYLENPDFREITTPVETLKRRREILREGVAFADRLMADLIVWGQLDEEQQEGFRRVKAEFLAEMTSAKQLCAKLLRDMPRPAQRPKTKPDPVAHIQAIQNNLRKSAAPQIAPGPRRPLPPSKRKKD